MRVPFRSRSVPFPFLVLCSGRPSLVCLVCLFVWFVCLVCLSGLFVWFVCLVCLFGLFVWFVGLVCWFAGLAVPFRSGRADLGPFRSVLPRSMWCGSRPVKMSPAFRDSLEMQMGGVVGQCMR